jgi:endonuclease-8
VPEGPEVYRYADRLNEVLAGEVAQEVWFAPPRLRARGRELSGTRLLRVEPRAKAFLIRFAELESLIYVHLQLMGVWEVRGPSERDPPTKRSLRLRIVTAKGRGLLYSASEIDVLQEQDLATHSYLGGLGPDVLRRGLTARAIRSRLESARFRRRSLGALYLDQAFLGGVGNYLRSETLFLAGLQPEHCPAELTEPELNALARATLEIPRRAYRTGGITNEPALAARLEAEGLPPRACRWKVFEREGQPCWDCSATVERWEISGRRLYCCPRCQA